jgi:hypothetical protein
VISLKVHTGKPPCPPILMLLANLTLRNISDEIRVFERMFEKSTSV